MAKPAEWLRGLLRPRLEVFATPAQSPRTNAGMVSIRLTTIADRGIRSALALGGAAIAGIGSFVWPDTSITTVALGMAAMATAIGTLTRTTSIADAPLARAAVRAALTEGSERGPQRWQVDGPAAVELGRELQRLQSLWLPVNAGESDDLDRARAAMIAGQASPRLAPYLGELSVAEHQAWLAIPASAQLTDEEPDHRAEYHPDGAEWPSLNTNDSGPTWPTLRDGDQP